MNKKILLMFLVSAIFFSNNCMSVRKIDQSEYPYIVFGPSGSLIKCFGETSMTVVPRSELANRPEMLKGLKRNRIYMPEDKEWAMLASLFIIRSPSYEDFAAASSPVCEK